jgi:purine-nucleoside phosphorylase
MSNIPTPHINAPAGAFADTVLMPGDPLRSKFIAENYLENPVLVNNVRGVQGYTGTWQGKKVSVMASGMGCPSIGIYSYELFKFYDVQNIIRIGSAGALSPDVHVRDLVVGLSAFTNSSYPRSFGFIGENAPCADFDLAMKAVTIGRERGLRIHCGPIFTSDAFYSEDDENEIVAKLGVLAVEMESAALYINASVTGKHALTICTISDSLVTGEALSAEERQNSFRDMMELGLALV